MIEKPHVVSKTFFNSIFFLFGKSSKKILFLIIKAIDHTFYYRRNNPPGTLGEHEKSF